jgi:type IV pilus assembly protein PilA
MRIQKRSRNRGGFTLIELMIVVGLVGLLAAIAIPNFLTYQARTRRSEGYTNVAGIATSYKAFQAERGSFPDMVTETTALGAAAASLPDPAAHGMAAPSTIKMPWDTATETFFGIVGWRPEGNVFYSYDVKSASCGNACTNQTCFTITAHGDVDGNGSLGALMYVHPMTDAAGNPIAECNSAIGNFPPPVRPPPPVGTGQPVYDEVAVRLSSDLY